MTDFDAFSPDPIEGDDDPFGAPSGGDADPFAAGEEQEEDPFAAGEAEEQDDPFAAGDASGDVFNAAEPDEDSTYEEAGDEPAYSEADEEPTLEEKTEPDVLPMSAVLGEWQSNRQEELRTRRDAAREGKEQQREKAKEELAKYLQDRQTRIAQEKVNNREEEQNQVNEMASLMEHGSQWEKVHKLVNLQPKPNEKKGSSRVDRMRQLLIQMKHAN